jgi:uncharacterized protein (TIGR03435 family)
MTVYALVLEKNGLKLKPAEGFGTSVSSSPTGRTMRANLTMKGFAGSLSSLMDRPVIDMTGQPGGFNINLDWVPDDMRSGDSIPGPTIYTALHDIGLKLEPRKAPVEILVVDRAEKVPVEN